MSRNRYGVPRRVIVWLGAVCAALLLTGCATGPRVSTEADPRADFSAYRSWAFYPSLALEAHGYETVTSEVAKEVVARQMQARGYVHDADNPDLWVNINAYLERRTDVGSVPTVEYAHYYNYRARRYVTVPYWTERTHVSRYTEGTMNVDMVDVRQNRLVWEGVAVGRAGDLTPEGRAARIEATVAEIFAHYPHQAGHSGP